MLFFCFFALSEKVKPHNFLTICLGDFRREMLCPLPSPKAFLLLYDAEIYFNPFFLFPEVFRYLVSTCG